MASIPRTLEEIAKIPREILTCQDVSYVLGASPATIHIQAMERPELLGFPTVRVKSRVKIPKRPFLEFMGWEESNGKVSER